MLDVNELILKEKTTNKLKMNVLSRDAMQYADELVENEKKARTTADDMLQRSISLKADAATTLSGYGITDAYTKTEIDEATQLLIDGLADSFVTQNYFSEEMRKVEKLSNKVDVVSRNIDAYGDDEYATARSVGAIWREMSEFGIQIAEMVVSHDEQIGDIETALDSKADKSEIETAIQTAIIDSWEVPV